jgi:glutathione synthase/RimK-type ligase-like ATP-grasp enzyme
MFKIYPYKVGSQSVRKLKDSLDAMIIRLNNSRYRYRDSHTIINWGSSRRPSWMSEDVPVLNKPEAVAVAANKLDTLEVLSDAGVATVPYTTDEETAQAWLEFGDKIFARQNLTGHSGEGIVVINPMDNPINRQLAMIARDLDSIGFSNLSSSVSDEIQEERIVPAPLYTRGIENTGEYRVHVFNGEVILYQKKSRRVDEDGNVVTPDGEEADVRNLASNWVYRTGNLRRLERIEELAKSAVSALGLDFGAVDIIKDQDGQVYVLEVNTAVGIGNDSTLEAYVSAFSNLS